MIILYFDYSLSYIYYLMLHINILHGIFCFLCLLLLLSAYKYWLTILILFQSLLIMPAMLILLLIKNWAGSNWHISLHLLRKLSNTSANNTVSFCMYRSWCSPSFPTRFCVVVVIIWNVFPCLSYYKILSYPVMFH